MKFLGHFADADSDVFVVLLLLPRHLCININDNLEPINGRLMPESLDGTVRPFKPKVISGLSYELMFVFFSLQNEICNYL